MTIRLLIVIAVALVGIAAVELSVRTVSSPQLAEVATNPDPNGALARIRQMPRDALGETPTATLVSGIALGRDEGMPDDDVQAFRTTGLAHLVAASGQNIALLVVAARVIGWMVGGGVWFCALLSLSSIPTYVVIVGGGPSIIRAAIVAELAILAWALGRLPSPAMSTALAAALTIWILPGIHRSLGWQLSFACVIGLMLFTSPWSHALQRGQIPQSVATACAATGACAAITAPILIAATGSAPALGSITNLIAIPLATAVLYLGLAGCLLGLVLTPASTALISAASVPAHAILLLARIASQAPGVAVSSPAVVVVTVLLVAGGELRSGRMLGGWVLVAAATIPVWGQVPYAMARIATPSTSASGLTILDVGQGHATVMTSQDEKILVDAGPPGGSLRTRLAQSGIYSLDALVMTHGSLDHRGGVIELRGALQPRTIAEPNGPSKLVETYVSPTGLRIKEHARLCEGDQIRSGNIRIVVLTPLCDGRVRHVTGDKDNDNAISIIVEMPGLTALVPSDVEASVLVQVQTLRREISRLGGVDVLVVSHHGSRDSGLPSLLKLITPQIAAIPVGENSYGHPAPETIGALRNAGVRIKRTDRDGNIHIPANGLRSNNLVR